MTPSDYLAWLDKQIAICTTWDNAVKPHETSQEADQFRIRARTLEQVREKFMSIDYPKSLQLIDSQEPDNQNSFTDGLD